MPCVATLTRVGMMHATLSRQLYHIYTAADTVALILPCSGWDHTNGPPAGKWERATCDAAFLPRTWGLRHDVLLSLAQSNLRAKLEIQSRLAKLYPEYSIEHMPSDHMQTMGEVQRDVTPAVEPDAVAEASASSPEELHSTQRDGKRQKRTREDVPAQSPERRCLAAPSAPSSAAGNNPPASGSSRTTVQEGTRPPIRVNDAAASSSEHIAAAKSNLDTQDASNIGKLQRKTPECSGAAAEVARVDCHNILGNAPMYLDRFSWHQDCDPWTLPLSAWTKTHGHYFNR